MYMLSKYDCLFTSCTLQNENIVSFKEIINFFRSASSGLGLYLFVTIDDLRIPEKTHQNKNSSVFGFNFDCLQNNKIQEELSFMVITFKKLSGSSGTKGKDGIDIDDISSMGANVTNYIDHISWLGSE